MRIDPTHTCFDDVLEYQAALVKADPVRALRQYIVHGICLAPEGSSKGEPYAHAWVEDDVESRVYQSGLVEGVKVWWGVDRTEWYIKMRVQERTRYTLAHAALENVRSKHFGPWVEKYRKLCGGTRVFEDVPSDHIDKS